MERGDFRAEWNPSTARGRIQQTINPYSLDSVLRIVHTLLLARRAVSSCMLRAPFEMAAPFSFPAFRVRARPRWQGWRLRTPHLLTDEISYVTRRNGRYFAVGTPFFGELARVGENLHAPHRGVVPAGQRSGKQNRADRGADAVRGLLGNILFFARDPEFVKLVFDTALRFCQPRARPPADVCARSSRLGVDRMKNYAMWLEARQIAARVLGDEMMIMSATNSTLFTLNEIASVIWEAADGVTPLDEIVANKICAQYDVTPEVALKDAEDSRRATWRTRHSACFPTSRSPVGRLAQGDPMSDLIAEMAAKALKLDIPLSVQLDLTYRCNERCVHCYLDHDDHGEMTTAEIKDLLDQMADAGVFFPDHQRRRDPDAQGFLRDSGVRPRADVLRQAQDQCGFDSREGSAAHTRLGVESVQISIYSHRPEVHDAITKLPGSLKQSIEAIRLLRAHGLHVIMANVLMIHNVSDYPGVKALAAELGAEFTMDPTITPMMDGDRSILKLNVDEAALQEVFRDESPGRKRGGILRSAANVDEDALDCAALQRRPHGLLRLSLRRRLSLCAVSSAQR